MLAAHAKMSLELRESPLGIILYIYMRQASEASVFNFSVQVKPKYSTEKGGGGGEERIQWTYSWKEWNYCKQKKSKM